MALLGPFKVGYPVAFRSGGDTTRQAFGKHIQEIERIYGILNALDAGKASSTEIGKSLQAHINDKNPHPNWKPSLSFNDIMGDLDASRVKGKLTNATIDASRVSGLTSLISGQIPTVDDKGDGITNSKLSNNGQVKFNNGLIIQWGTVHYQTGTPFYYKFHTEFPNNCFAMTCQGHGVKLVDWSTKGATQSEYSRVLLYDWNKAGFLAIVQLYQTVETDGNAVYIAIGN